jgi:hypothetical protein
MSEFTFPPPTTRFTEAHAPSARRANIIPSSLPQYLLSKLPIPTLRLLPLLHTRNIHLLNQTLRRRVRPHNLALNLANAKLRLQHAHHAQQPPRRIARLRAHAHPVPRARNVEPDVFPRASVGVAGPWGLRLGVVGTEDFEGARVAGCSGGALGELELGVGD